MSQIVGVRKLKHTNSFTGVVPKFGVEPTNEGELTAVSTDGLHRLVLINSAPIYSPLITAGVLSDYHIDRWIMVTSQLIYLTHVYHVTCDIRCTTVTLLSF